MAFHLGPGRERRLLTQVRWHDRRVHPHPRCLWPGVLRLRRGD
ncbi:hypothetical protein LDJ84_10030 [Pseudomonas sp. HS-18]|nr:hypothetical protein LDJ84_10030 [Pseudomonas sp. HS-18]